MVSSKKGLYCSKTSLNWDETNDEDESQGKNTESSTVKDGGSSSNSSVEEVEKKPSSIRPYVRSKMPRLRWTPDLHRRFIHAVERLGGQDRATPKSVLQLMDIKGLEIAHVKSHLQMYRSKKIEESNLAGMTDHTLFMESRDQNIFNLCQFPFLANHTQRQTSNLRYEDASRNVCGKWMGSSTMEQNPRNKTRPGFDYSPIFERVFNNHFYRSADLDLCSKIAASFKQESTRRSREDLKESCRWYRSVQNPTVSNSMKLMQQRLNSQRVSPHSVETPSIWETDGLKRKTSDCELDLNLTLGVESRNKEEQRGIVLDDECLNLSLHGRRMKKAKGILNVGGAENARGMSTLDLTL